MLEKLQFDKFSYAEEREKIKFFKSSQEYLEGKIPFAYQYVFPDEKILKASQDKEGLGHVIIIENGKVIFDFLSLAPLDTKLVTPAYFEKHTDDKLGKNFFRNGSGWGMDFLEKKVFCGEFKNPKQILSLLHELGHLNKNTAAEFQRQEYLTNFIPASDTSLIASREQILAADKEFTKLKSKIEREAWSWALIAVRKISRETGIDFLHLFPKFQDFKNYIRDRLRLYRHSHEWIIIGHDENFYKEMEKLFDRWKYSSDAGETNT